jgi:ApaG protein
MRKTNILTPYVAVTDDVVVTVLPAFLEHESDHAKQLYVWGYAIRIRNNRDDSIKLAERHWIVYDAQGRKEETRGDGVVGEQPVIMPGLHYDYKSGVPLKTPSGMMEGRYRFIRNDNSDFWVTIPSFSLDSPYDTSNHH